MRRASEIPVVDVHAAEEPGLGVSRRQALTGLGGALAIAPFATPAIARVEDRPMSTKRSTHLQNKRLVSEFLR